MAYSSSSTGGQNQICLILNASHRPKWQHLFKSIEGKMEITRGEVSWKTPEVVPIWNVIGGELDLRVPVIDRPFENHHIKLKPGELERTEIVHDDGRTVEKHHLLGCFSFNPIVQRAMTELLPAGVVLEPCGEFRIAKIESLPPLDIMDSFMKSIQTYDQAFAVTVADFVLKTEEGSFVYQNFDWLAGFSAYSSTDAQLIRAQLKTLTKRAEITGNLVGNPRDLDSSTRAAMFMEAVKLADEDKQTTRIMEERSMTQDNRQTGVVITLPPELDSPVVPSSGGLKVEETKMISPIRAISSRPVSSTSVRPSGPTLGNMRERYQGLTRSDMCRHPRERADYQQNELKDIKLQYEKVQASYSPSVVSTALDQRALKRSSEVAEFVTSTPAAKDDSAKARLATGFIATTRTVSKVRTGGGAESLAGEKKYSAEDVMKAIRDTYCDFTGKMDSSYSNLQSQVKAEQETMSSFRAALENKVKEVECSANEGMFDLGQRVDLLHEYICELKDTQSGVGQHLNAVHHDLMKRQAECLEDSKLTRLAVVRLREDIQTAVTLRDSGDTGFEGAELSEDKLGRLMDKFQADSVETRKETEEQNREQVAEPVLEVSENREAKEADQPRENDSKLNAVISSRPVLSAAGSKTTKKIQQLELKTQKLDFEKEESSSTDTASVVVEAPEVDIGDRIYILRDVEGERKRFYGKITGRVGNTVDMMRDDGVSESVDQECIGVDPKAGQELKNRRGKKKKTQTNVGASTSAAANSNN